LGKATERRRKEGGREGGRAQKPAMLRLVWTCPVVRSRRVRRALAAVKT